MNKLITIKHHYKVIVILEIQIVNYFYGGLILKLLLLVIWNVYELCGMKF